jgi:hypothetical protein
MSRKSTTSDDTNTGTEPTLESRVKLLEATLVHMRDLHPGLFQGGPGASQPDTDASTDTSLDSGTDISPDTDWSGGDR